MAIGQYCIEQQRGAQAAVAEFRANHLVALPFMLGRYLWDKDFGDAANQADINDLKGLAVTGVVTVATAPLFYLADTALLGSIAAEEATIGASSFATSSFATGSFAEGEIAFTAAESSVGSNITSLGAESAFEADALAAEAPSETGAFGMSSAPLPRYSGPFLTSGTLHSQALGLAENAANAEGFALSELCDQVAVIPKGLSDMPFTWLQDGKLTIFFNEETLMADEATQQLVASHELLHCWQSSVWEDTLGLSRPDAFAAYYWACGASQARLAPVEYWIESRAFDTLEQTVPNIPAETVESHLKILGNWERYLQQ